MVSGVVVVEFTQGGNPATYRTIRVLVRNAEDVHQAIVKGVPRAIELAGGQ